MKVAILYDSKYGNTKQVAEFLAEKVGAGGHEGHLFRTGESKPEDLLAVEPEVLLVGGPTHIGRPARALRKYLKKMGKIIEMGTSVEVKQLGVFNCYNNDIVCDKITKKIVQVFPNVKIYEISLPLRTKGLRGPLSNDWEDKASTYIAGFLNFL
ncbi:MAG: hypothetical protein HWN66_11865 [Candidatus Helarchaeota archaeon]|nr:hypothetical protein [Candidatus Helarchaeota archaeon]